MSKKRGGGEGSIFQLPDGRWRGTVSLGFRNGKRWRKTYEAESYQAVQQKLTDAKHDHKAGYNIAPDRQAVGQFLSYWLDTIKSDVAPSTYVSYEGLVRLHLKPALGRFALTRLRAQHVQQLKKDLLTTPRVVIKPSKEEGEKPQKTKLPPLSSRSVQYCLAVLRMALDEACKLDLIPRNPAMLVDFPKVEHEEIQPFTPGEAQAFIETAKAHRLGAMFSVALAIGLRKGEALGLWWSDIDFGAGRLAVNRSLQRIKMPGEKRGKLLLREPKRRSRRTIMLPQVALSTLLSHRAKQEAERAFAGARWQEKGFVFTSSIGTPVEPRNAADAFTEILKAAKLPRIRVHDLRHTAATLLLVQGVHPRVVMDLLGHSQIAVTMNTYSHVIPALQKEAAQQMDAVLNPVAQVVAQVAPSSKPN